MAWWGAAFVLSPNIHIPTVTPAHSIMALDELEEGIRFAGSSPAGRLAKKLIEAAMKRFSRDPNANRQELNAQYRDAMRVIYKENPNDPDIGALFADALMLMHPWQYWNSDGSPADDTDEMVATLESVLKMDPYHAMALHFHIHAFEASRTPNRAELSADRLLGLEPHLIGHLEHMPSHIYVLIGRWKDAVNANLAAVRNDKELIRVGAVNENNDMIPAFMAHNRETLAFAASAIGRSKLSLEHIREMSRLITPKFAEIVPHFADYFTAGPYEYYIRVGEWDQMLALPPPNPSLHLSTAFYHGCRALSLAALKRPSEARKEQALSNAAIEKLDKPQRYLANTGQGYVNVLVPLVEGEILIAENKRNEAVNMLKVACGFSDQLSYEHPPMFVVSPRHPLGALLLELGRAEEAMEVYRKDLQQWPNNGWSLKGLHRCHERLAEDYKKKFDGEWSEADISTDSSCCCLPANESE
jgi:tetratricopeptide (TPR) repeat protein